MAAISSATPTASEYLVSGANFVKGLVSHGAMKLGTGMLVADAVLTGGAVGMSLYAGYQCLLTGRQNPKIAFKWGAVMLLSSSIVAWRYLTSWNNIYTTSYQTYDRFKCWSNVRETPLGEPVHRIESAYCNAYKCWNIWTSDHTLPDHCNPNNFAMCNVEYQRCNGDSCEVFSHLRFGELCNRKA